MRKYISKILGLALVHYCSLSAADKLRVESNGNVGVGVDNAVEKLEINGGIKISNSTQTNAGTIRWTGSDFEGYNGSTWVSLTTPSFSSPYTLAYPQGANGTGVLHNINNSSYTVPTGKVFYQTHGFVRANSINLSNPNGGPPNIWNAGDVLSASTSTVLIINGGSIEGGYLISGFLVDASSITGLFQTVTDTSSYTVPTGKVLVLRKSEGSLLVDGIQLETSSNVGFVFIQAGSVLSRSSVGSTYILGYLKDS